MSKVKPSEFGGHEGRSGVAMKPIPRLTPSEKLRLGYTTGINDPDSVPDRSAWLGEKLETEE